MAVADEAKGMQRRDALRRAGAAGATLLAGCLSRGRPPDYGGGGSTASPTPGVVDTSFEVTDRGPGGGDDATVTFDEDVTVEGTIRGNNGCYTAELAGASLDDGTLAVRVRAYEDRDEDELCTQALVGIGYRATVAVAGRGPDRVVVVHERDGEATTVADVRG